MLWIVAIIEAVIGNFADMGILLGIQVCVSPAASVKLWGDPQSPWTGP